MSASPPCSPPRRALHECSNSQSSKLQIRVVPYSPPRPSDATSTASSRPVSYAGTTPDPDSTTARSTPCSRIDDDSPTPTRGKARASTVSSLRRPSSISTTPDQSDSGHSDADTATRPTRGRAASAASSRPSSSSSRRKVIKINPDKTFSLVTQDRSASTRIDSFASPPSVTTASSSFGRYSSPAFSEDYPTNASVPLTPLTERSFASDSPSESLTPRRQTGSASGSPWTYRMVGGIRRVAKTPDKKQRQAEGSDFLSAEPLPSLPELTQSSSVAGPSSNPLNAKPSFQSYISQSESNFSDKTNYRVYGTNSPVISVANISSLPPSPTHNYHILAESSSSGQSVQSFHEQSRPHTGESEANFVIHGNPSETSSVITAQRPLRSEYSQESLVVAPLRPARKASSESFAISTSRSRESLRRGSLTSITNVLTQEAARALFLNPPVRFLPPGTTSRQDTSSSASTPSQAAFPMYPAQPHQWSSQLSTVMSETEDSDGPSRSLSPVSPVLAVGRRGSGFNSNHSRQVLSIASSLPGLDELISSDSMSRSPSLEPPAAIYARSPSRDPNSGMRLVRDHDEDGDGLADLEDLYRPSRSRLGSFLSTRSSDRNLRSSGSSHSRTNSFTSIAVPTWARLYYGSGERRYLAAQASSDSMFSRYNNDSRPGSSAMSRTPSRDGPAAAEIYSPRRRPHELPPHLRHNRESSGSMEIRPASSHPVAVVVRHIKEQTSSIWSPHLARDRRATKFGLWDPPVPMRSVDKGLTGRRNAQITMLVIGFIFPFSWMMAALFPLPADPRLNAAERGENTNQLDDVRTSEVQKRLANNFDEDMYENIKWWRNINRIMAIIGLLVIGAVTALVVVGVRQRWGS